MDQLDTSDEASKAKVKQLLKLVASSPPPNVEGVAPSAETPTSPEKESKVKAKSPRRTPTGTGKGKAPPKTPSSGGGGGGFNGWWKGQSFIFQAIALFFLLAAFIVSMDALTIAIGKWMDEAQREKMIGDAEAKAQESEILKRVKPTHLQSTTDLPVIFGPSFDCRTEESYQQGFSSSETVEEVPGRKLLLRNGCAWVRFDHEITSLEGHGYVVTFDPPSSRNPDMCGAGKAGRDDSPGNCIAFLNNHIGEKFRVVIDGGDAYLKLGGVP